MHIALNGNHMRNVITFLSSNTSFQLHYDTRMKLKLSAFKSSLMNIFILICINYKYYRSTENITRNSNWRGYHWCPQPINLDMFSRRKPITKIPMAAKTANSAGKKHFHFITNGLGVINQLYMR